MIHIRDEVSGDVFAREALLHSAFGEARFRKTSERLREGRLPAAGLALVAEDDGVVVGTVRLWNISAGPSRASLLLGPLAVSADRQSCGLGAKLMRVAMGRAAELGHGSVLLVGDAPYYERFGFTTAHTARLWLPGPYETSRFLGCELVAGSLDGAAGLVNATGIATPAQQPAFALREAA
ncbi:N-acetyltransferase [Terrihabitans rhizophilus]|uniref:N-acetyltransferase n=1 Tax=Terrihabitans rhizophilus TaxID=3092662 RepID=A0ABU4RQS0_9HYPH|nr:N-acetyltransferase [Terrihabitans sp. PJ23]MDX6807187.1 N-acetyltransferase [Terrihabitans sp. PJ23]